MPDGSDCMEARRLRFEARRFALDALLRVHLQEAEEARVYLLSHARLLSTLSLGALAGVVTLFAAAARLGAGGGTPPLFPAARLVLAAASLVLLLAAALLAAHAVQRAARDAAATLARPYPAAAHGLLTGGGPAGRAAPADEDAVLDALVRLLEERRGGEAGGVAAGPRSAAVAALVSAGLAAAGAAVLYPAAGPVP